MNFIIQDHRNATAEAQQQSRARTGKLSFEQHSISTPAIISYAKKGAPVHLSRDNVDRLPIEMVMLAYEHFIEYNPPTFLAAPFGLKRYLGLRHKTATAEDSATAGNQEGRAKKQQPHVLIASLRDAADQEEIVGNTEQYVACRSFRGVNRITSEQFQNITLSKAPDVLLAMADEPIGLTSSQKRLHKSLARSEKWLAALLQKNNVENTTAIFAPLVGGVNAAARAEYAKTLCSPSESTSSQVFKSIAGFSINLNNLRAPDHAGIESVDLEATTELAAASLDNVDLGKPRLALCPNGPHEILAMVARNGIDLFMDEWSSALSSMGVALDFMLPSASEVTETSNQGALELGINLFDDKYARDFTPLGNSELAAALAERYGAEALGDRPTKAYIHHLLQTHEMTSHVLLAMHNTCVMELFMHTIRESIEDGTFSHRKGIFEKMYTRRLSAWTEASEEWSRVNRERGKGRLKGLGQERKPDADAAAEGDATPIGEQERMSFEDPEDKMEQKLKSSSLATEV